jgi:hypothetical protein
MGGNNSRLINPSGGDTLPAKFRPLFRQRIEEFRNRRNVRKEDGAMSKKELLKDDDGNSNERSSNANEIFEETQPRKDEKTTACVVPVEKLSQVAPLPVYEYGNEKEDEEEEEERKGHKNHDQEKKDKDIEKKIAVVKSALLLEDNKHDDEEEEDDKEDEDEDEDDIGRLISPGSPSFRIYCIEAEERKERESFDTDTHEVSEYLDEKENQDIDVHHKSDSTDSDESVTSESENADNSNEVIN